MVSDLGEPDLAIDLMGRALELSPYDPEGREMLATFLRRKGDLDGAIAEYERAVAVDPELTNAHVELADAYAARGWPDKAAASFRRALVTNPNHGAALVGLANLYARLGPVGWSVPLYERAIPLSAPWSLGGLYANLANAWATLGEHARAAGLYREALRRAPGDAQTHYALGCSLAYLGDRPGARAEWRRALELDPTHEPARTNLERLSD